VEGKWSRSSDASARTRRLEPGLSPESSSDASHPKTVDVVDNGVIGGTSFAGGRGTIFEAMIGALLMGSLNNGMTLMNLPTFHQDTARGLVLLLAVALDVISRRRAGSS
jgi:ABC-type xylose transport system permease subunit